MTWEDEPGIHIDTCPRPRFWAHRQKVEDLKAELAIYQRKYAMLEEYVRDMLEALHERPEYLREEVENVTEFLEMNGEGWE